MAICPACSFKDYLDLETFDVTLPDTSSDPGREATLQIVVCGTCGNVFCSNWKEFFLDNFSGKITRQHERKLSR